MLLGIDLGGTKIEGIVLESKENPKEIISLSDRIEKIKLNIIKKSKKISAASLEKFSKIWTRVINVPILRILLKV